MGMDSHFKKWKVKKKGIGWKIRPKYPVLNQNKNYMLTNSAGDEMEKEQLK